MDDGFNIAKVNTIEEAKKFKYKVKHDCVLVKPSAKSEWIKICSPVYYEGEEDDDFYISYLNKNECGRSFKGKFIDDFISEFIKEDVTLYVDYPIPFRPLIKAYLYKLIKDNKG